MNVRITTHGYELTTEFDKYIAAKVATVAKQVPRKLRAHTSCRLHFTQTKRGAVKFNTCNFTVVCGDSELQAKETTQHMYAALDVASVHVAQQLQDHLRRQRSERLRARLRRLARGR